MIGLGVCIAGKRQSGTYRCIHSIKEGVGTNLFCKPSVIAPFVYVLKFEEELRLRQMELVARTIVVVPASDLQQTTEDIDFLSVGEYVDVVDDAGIQCSDAIHWFLLYTIVGCQLGDELIHEDRTFIGGVGG